MSNKLNSIAVLIDADNASAKNIGLVLTKIETLGKKILRSSPCVR